jgi:hypothetical protein
MRSPMDAYTIVFERSGSHVVRVAPRCYVIVYCDERQAQWTTPNSEGGLYWCKGLGDRPFAEVCAYAARFGTRYRSKRAAVERVTEELQYG